MTKLSVAVQHSYATDFSLDLNFETTSRVTAFFGPSGSGKSSALKFIAGMVKPDAGIISLGDQTYFDSEQGINVAPELRHIGYVFQDSMLFPHLSVKQNLEYGLKRRRISKYGISIEKVVDILELSHCLDRFPRSLSGGEQQRVSLGRALLCGPQLLLLDEPFSALDEELKGRVMDYFIKALDTWKIPVIFVSHSMDEVSTLGADIIQFDSGVCRQPKLSATQAS